jgi:hypothetical protein
MCTAANGVGEPAVAQLALHVLYPPVLEAAGGGGGGSGSGGRILGGIGRRIELRCRIWAEPEPEVKWLKNGVQELVEIPGIRQVKHEIRVQIQKQMISDLMRKNRRSDRGD